MTKSELIAAIAASAGTSLTKGEKVTITGFGTFQISARAARTWVNPRNPSEKIQIPAMNLPTFKAGKSLKDSVR